MITDKINLQNQNGLDLVNLELVINLNKTRLELYKLYCRLSNTVQEINITRDFIDMEAFILFNDGLEYSRLLNSTLQTNAFDDHVFSLPESFIRKMLRITIEEHDAIIEKMISLGIKIDDKYLLSTTIEN